MNEHTLKDFLEIVPPGKAVAVSDIVFPQNTIGDNIDLPDIQLHCSSPECEGIRFFTPKKGDSDYDDGRVFLSKRTNANNVFLVYECRNCKKTIKTYSITFSFTDKWLAVKYGEIPSFGPPTPSRAIKLIGPDKELFLLGRRSEDQGMGIGAFVYYRRVVENQKNRIFDEVIKVTKIVSPSDRLISELEAAKGETQFSKAVESIKHGLPQSLLINGHNPLLLLHSALSEGVHANDDATCLELATSIRIVLIEFAERLGQALKDEAELTEAVKRLASKRNKNS